MCPHVNQEYLHMAVRKLALTKRTHLHMRSWSIYLHIFQLEIFGHRPRILTHASHKYMQRQESNMWKFWPGTVAHVSLGERCNCLPEQFSLVIQETWHIFICQPGLLVSDSFSSNILEVEHYNEKYLLTENKMQIHLSCCFIWLLFSRWLNPSC
jgi:hypothetical protein